MPILLISNRMPSLVVLQHDPLSDLVYTDGQVQLKIKGPLLDDRLSANLPWVHVSTNRRYRLADMLVVEAQVAHSVVVREGEHYSVTEDAPAFDLIEAIVRRNAKRLLLLLQVETGQAWIGLLPKFSAWHDNPMEYQLFDDDGSAMLLPTGISEPDVDERWWLTEETWQRIGQRMMAGEDPALPRILLAEAFGFEIGDRPRSAVLSLAMACEIAVKRYLSEVVGATQPLYRYIVEHDRHTSIMEYLEHVLALASGGENIRDRLSVIVNGNRVGYGHLKWLFEARNGIVHRGKSEVSTNSGAVRVVDDAILEEFRAVAGAFVEWIEELSAGASSAAAPDNSPT